MKRIFMVFFVVFCASFTALAVPEANHGTDVSYENVWNKAAWDNANDNAAFKRRYYVTPYSVEDGVYLKGVLEVQHEFGETFSANIPAGMLGTVESMADITPVGKKYISKKPTTAVCGNGECEPTEDEVNCPEDCSVAPSERTCYPSVPYPWGVQEVNGGAGGSGVIVAVLDTGVYTEHLDLASNIVGCVDTTKVRVKSGCADLNGHGTHVAGTIAANAGSDGLGIYGVAPQAGIMAVRVLGADGSGWSDDIARGITYAADNGANVISMSLGSAYPDPYIQSAVQYAVGKGVLVIAAAGNSGPDYDTIEYPGAYPEVVAVAAIDSSRNVASFSSRGINDGDYIMEAREVELAAPGVSVLSTYNNGCYATGSGTSMATPHVSGLAAKFWQGDADSTRAYLQSIALDISVLGDDPATGFGLPNAS